MLKQGNAEYNTNAKLNKGELIPIRRPNSGLHHEAGDYTICYECLGTYVKTGNRSHICTKKIVKGDRSTMRLNRLVEGRFHEKASKRLTDVLSSFNDDEVSNLVNYDWLLISFGNELMEKHDKDYQHDMVKSQLKLLGRVLIEIRRIEPTVTDFASLFNAQVCNSVIEGIRAVAGFDPSERLFRAPATALSAVTQIKHVGQFLSNENIANKNKELKEQTDDFISLFTARVATRINRQATNTQIKNKRLNPQVIPTTDDINLLHRYLSDKRKAYCEQLTANFSLQAWTNLLEVTTASIMLFGRKRVGEMQNTLTDDYHARAKIEKNDVLYLALPEVAKQRVNRYVRMEVRGKKERTVPILLHLDVLNCIELVLKYREAAGIPTENKRLFALPSANPKIKRFVNGCAILRKFSGQCGAAKQKILRGTKIRKHFAAFCATKEINDNTITDVSNYMGHSVHIHKDIYRGNAVDREIVKLSELLEEATGSHESSFQTESVVHADDDRGKECQLESNKIVEADSVPRKKTDLPIILHQPFPLLSIKNVNLLFLPFHYQFTSEIKFLFHRCGGTATRGTKKFVETSTRIGSRH